MSDSGELTHNDLLGGAQLKLFGLDHGLRRLRAYVGPRLREPSCGAVGVYRTATPLGWLYATPQSEGRLQLMTLRERALVGDLTEQVWLLKCGCRADDGRSGFLHLRTLDRDAHPRDIARLEGAGTGQAQGRLVLFDGGLPETEVYAMLGFDQHGVPELTLAHSQRSVTVSPEGIRFSPDKGDWDFVAAHPTDPAVEIHYSVVEGPEVGVYVRGTCGLAQGFARVPLPEHFAHVASDEGLTAQVTPRSSKSKGLAVTSLSPRELVVEELFEGKGDYEVDYMVNGVRKGRDAYEVVRPRRSKAVRPPMGADRPAASATRGR